MWDRLNPESVVNTSLLLMVLLGILFAYSFFIEPGMVVVKEVQINGTGVHMKVVFLSDFQRMSTDPEFMQQVVELTERENPDIILLGGDYIETSESELPSAAPLKTLHARYGVYGVMGNHDYGMITGREFPPNDLMASGIRAFLEDSGIRILSNEHVQIGNVTIIGLDDLWAGERDEAAALSGNISGYRILLSHNQYGLPITKSDADLYLFGHTHCGQIRLPGLGSVPKLFGFRGEYEMGYYKVNGSDVYTTCGLAGGPRFLAPPEVTVIELN
ncbi:metallophosphoesterase [Candidatus Micrarchaeota archaeon]|nr:metallophosphoesterase [Candidatus Micrarchaeota archaeon]